MTGVSSTSGNGQASFRPDRVYGGKKFVRPSLLRRMGARLGLTRRYGMPENRFTIEDSLCLYPRKNFQSAC